MDDSGEPFVTLVARRGVVITHEAFGKDRDGQTCITKRNLLRKASNLPTRTAKTRPAEGELADKPTFAGMPNMDAISGFRSPSHGFLVSLTPDLEP